MEKPETGIRKSGYRSWNLQLVACCLVLAVYCLFTGCVSAPVLPPPPQKHVFKEEKIAERSANSLWQDTNLYEDKIAKRLNDLVTINVVENITGAGTADTNATKKSSADASVTGLFGAPLDLGMAFNGANKFSPSVSGSSTDNFTGKGATTRAGKLLGTITARVVEVMPNGNLVIEARKEITINYEKQTLILRGMIRTKDVAVDNTILSTKVADAEVYFIGDGIVQDKQRPGWLAQLLDKVWPF